MTTSAEAKTIVTAAVSRLFGQKDASAIDEYFGPVYVQHSALGVDGLEGVRTLVASLPANFAYELVRVIADGDLVVTHGLYFGFGPAPVVGFDVWRVDGAGRIVEHWDALAPASGPDPRAAVDGPTEPQQAESGEQNRALVLGDLESAADLVQHAPAYAMAPGATTNVVVRQSIAEGDLVFTRAAGEVGGAAAILNDLWRIENGAAVEHWTLVAPVPATLPHDNGVF
ncbi:MAG: hypothetical protein BGO97_09505 [Micrococcales bacterium 70-64]|nr:nuclear transport factor 2 family protein [Leifsonia sp.]ODU64241.1 MAG: hypothetical protein ABT06_09510 [Leifsonia sp. SCN 70-46]OJX85931.1 MAG: hypothetical protein BGO97_09505 [Micrococcales bacterium 70-64]